METDQTKKIFDIRTVIVIDTSNYKTDYAENTPFKAQVLEISELNILVRSTVTNREYELYYTQILEALDIGEISRLIDLKEYGG